MTEQIVPPEAFPFVEIGLAMFQNVKFLLFNPLIYLVIFLIVMQYRRVINNERRMFNVRINSVTEQTLVSMGYGLLAGIIASFLLLTIGVVLNPYDMLYVWVVAIIVALLHVRFLCFSYATGILGVLAFITIIWPAGSALPVVGKLWDGLANLNVPVIIALVAILHLTESLLILLEGSRKPSPVLVSSKRGQLVGGYAMQKFWFVPLFIIVAIDPLAIPGLTEPDPAAGGMIYFPEWWPLLPISAISGLILGMLPVPAVLGYGDVAVSRSPRAKSRQTAFWLAIYSVVLLGLALISVYSPWLLLLAALFSAGAHELVIQLGQRKEFLDKPLFYNPLRGIRILHVFKGSTAEKIGLKSGEIIAKVNGFPINSEQDFHFALSLQSVYARMEVIDNQGELRFVSTAVYQGEHHVLGLILVPRNALRGYMMLSNAGLFSKLGKLFSKKVGE